MSATNDPSTVSKKPTKILLPPKANDQTKQKLDFGDEDGSPSVSQAEQVQVNRVKSSKEYLTSPFYLKLDLPSFFFCLPLSTLSQLLLLLLLSGFP